MAKQKTSYNSSFASAFKNGHKSAVYGQKEVKIAEMPIKNAIFMLKRALGINYFMLDKPIAR